MRRTPAAGMDPARAGAQAPEFVHLPRGIAHSFRVESETARVFNVVSPAGFEHFLAEFGEPAAADELPPEPAGPPDLARMAAVLSDYGVEILGPPPS